MSTVHQAVQSYYPEASAVRLAPVTRMPSVPVSAVRLTPLQKWGYGFLAFAVAFAMFQVVRCGVVSALKLQGLFRQMAVVEHEFKSAQERNDTLQDQIARYQSPLGVEEMARERLGMVAQDEVLVRIYPTALAQR